MRTFQPPEEKKAIVTTWGSIPKLPLAWDCCLYPRISTPGQRGNVSSELQLREDGELWNLALRYGWLEKQIRFPKDDMELSGQLKMEERPAFKLMLTWIIRGEVRAILAVQVDRLFRDKFGAEYGKFMEICEKHKVLVITPYMIYDFSDGNCITSFRDKCIQAWDFLDYQVYNRMLGAKTYLGQTGRWEGGNLPIGYIPDRDRRSPTYRRFLIYRPHARIVFELFVRYRELRGNLIQLHREMSARPFFFPDFEDWVDPEIIAKIKLKKVPGGYTMSLTSLQRLLTNPVYIGWWHFDDTLLVDESGTPKTNHEPIIPPEQRDELFWYAFRQRSAFNIDGTKNTEVVGQKPRRYTQETSPVNPALLKELITSGDEHYIVTVQPQYNNHNERTGKYLYSFRKKMNGYSSGAKYMLSTDLVDNVFWQQLMTHLWQTEDFTEFARTEEKITETVASEREEITEQIAACDRAVSKLLQRLAAVEDDPDDEEEEQEDEEIEVAVTKKFIKKLKDKCSTFTAEKKRLLVRLEKLEQNGPDSYSQQMITYHQLLRQIGEKARQIYTLEELREIVDIFATEILLDTIAPRVWKLTITWRDPSWGIDEIISLREGGNPSVTWTDAEKELLKRHYTVATRQELLQLLPNRSWIGIRTIASGLKLKRHRDDSKDMFPTDICLNDYHAIDQYGLSAGVNCVRSWR